MITKRALIIKESRVTIHYEASHLHIVSPCYEQYIGFNQVSACYINQNIQLNMHVAMQIAKKVPLYFINKNGTIIATISFQV